MAEGRKRREIKNFLSHVLYTRDTLIVSLLTSKLMLIFPLSLFIVYIQSMDGVILSIIRGISLLLICLLIFLKTFYK